MTSAQVVETLFNVISNSPSQDYTHLDDRTLLNYENYSLTVMGTGIDGTFIEKIATREER